MGRLSRRAMLLAVLGGALLLGGAARAGEGDGGTDPNNLWAEAIDLFDRGQLRLAKEKFDALLKHVDANRAAVLVERAGIKTMIRLLSAPAKEVGRTPAIVWELYSKYHRRRLIDPDFIRKWVNLAVDEKTDEVERFKAFHQLRRIGQYAVPELAKHLSDRSDMRRTLTRITLSKIGRRGTLAMVKLVDTGDVLAKETLVLAISDIVPVDSRAVPALKRLYDGTEAGSTLKKKTAFALRKITGVLPEQMSPYADYYYLEANRCYLEKSGVPEEALEADGVVWRLEEGKLAYRRVPVYSWNEEMAEEMAHECLRHAPGYERMFPLLISAALAQREEVEAIQEAIKIAGAPPTLTETDKKLLAEREKLLVEVKLLAQAGGARHLYRAVGKALRDECPLVGAAAIDLLPLVDPYGSLLPPLPKPEPVVKGRKARSKKKRRRREPEVKPDTVDAGLVTASEILPKHEGQPLVDALDSPDDGVAVSAAIALAKMDPVAPYPGSEKVVVKLADAISKAGPLQVLVVEENDDAFKEIKTRVEALGWGVTRATSGRDALNKAGGFPPKDLLLISAKLKADLPTKGEGDKPGLLEMLALHRTASLVPLALLVAEKERKAEEAKFGKVFMITRDTEGLALRKDILSALGRTGPGITKQRREELARRAAEALLEIHPRRTQVRVADASTACMKALVNRPDEVRNPCIRALGLFRVKVAAPKLMELFNDKKNTVVLRGNCLYALGWADPVAARKLFLKAMNDETEYGLRDLAARGYGLSEPSPKEETEFQQKCRMERSKEGGLPAGKTAATAPAKKPAAEKDSF